MTRLDANTFTLIHGIKCLLLKRFNIFSIKMYIHKIVCHLKGVTQKVHKVGQNFWRASRPARLIVIGTVYEKGPYEENIWNVYICGQRPLLEHGVYEKVPCAHACARLSRLSFRALLTSG